MTVALVAASFGWSQPVQAQDGLSVFGYHTYRVVDVVMSWHDAVDYCEQSSTLGGYLVSINSFEENEFVYWLAQDTWLGATDEAAQGVWRWVSGEPFTYTNWRDEPSNESPAYLAFSGVSGAWNPRQDEWRPFVCEYNWVQTIYPSNGAGTRYTFTYGSDFTCSGLHVVNKVSVKDSEICLLSGDRTGLTAGKYQGNPTGMTPWGYEKGWLSDYNGVAATSWKMTMVDNRNGTFTMHIVAYY
jgi:hypothetical protein